MSSVYLSTLNNNYYFSDFINYLKCKEVATKPPPFLLTPGSVAFFIAALSNALVHREVLILLFKKL